MEDNKEIRADAKLKNLPAEALEELWLMRNPGEDGEKLTLEAIAVEVPLRYGFTCSVSSLSEFYKWLRLRKRIEGARLRAEQTKWELAKDPSMTPEDLERAAQTVFTAETLEAGDVKGYVALAKLRLASRALDHDARRLAVLEKKAAQADEAAGVAHNQKLTPEEKAAELKRIFRMG
jgi:hypothetical protein